MNKPDLHQTNTILNRYKQWPSISAIRTTIYEMSWPLSSVLTLHRSVQLKLNADVNWTVKRTQKKKACAKQNGIKWCQQCTKADVIGRNRAWLAQRLWTETNCVKNTTSISSCNLAQVMLTNYPHQNTYERNNDNIACQLLHQSWW